MTVSTFTATDLGWRTSALGEDARLMSLDNIRISQVPEPSMMILLLGGLTGLLIWRIKD